MSAEKLQLTQTDDRENSILRSLPFQTHDEPEDIQKAAADHAEAVMDRYREQLRDAMRELTHPA